VASDEDVIGIGGTHAVSLHYDGAGASMPMHPSEKTPQSGNYQLIQ
jgi:hypothetical protein